MVCVTDHRPSTAASIFLHDQRGVCRRSSHLRARGLAGRRPRAAPRLRTKPALLPAAGPDALREFHASPAGCCRGALRPHFYHVYAYCRWADDLADETGDARASLELLDWWESNCTPVTRAKRVIRCSSPWPIRSGEFEIPPEPFLALLVAFRQDQRITRYETFDELLGYCRNSADPVGRLVLYLGRCHDEPSGRLADAVCTGLQLANFWQDVAGDWDRGRIYLPLADCRRFGYNEEDFVARRASPEFRRLLAFEVDRAERWLRDGLPLVEQLPGRLRGDVWLFVHGGLKSWSGSARSTTTSGNVGPRSRGSTNCDCCWAACVQPGRRTPGKDAMSEGLEASYAYCRQLTRQTAGNFYYSFLVLPRHKRQAMCALYAFARQTDDLSDNSQPVELAAPHCSTGDCRSNGPWTANRPAPSCPRSSTRLRTTNSRRSGCTP